MAACPLVGSLGEPASYRAAADAQDGYVHTAFDGRSGIGPVTDRIALETILAAAKRPRPSDRSRRPIASSSTHPDLWVLGPAPDPAAEDAAINPIPIVAWRPGNEELVLGAASEQLRTMVVRPGVVYGGGNGLVGDLFKSAMNGLVRVIGDGNNHWPLVYDRDLADLYARAGGTIRFDRCLPRQRRRRRAGQRYRRCDRAVSPGKPDVRHVPIDEARTKFGAVADALSLDQRARSPRARAIGWAPSLHSVAGNAARLLDEWRAERA